MADQPSPRRRFQFRLRTLFVVMTIVAVQCAVCMPMWREWERCKEEPQVEELIDMVGPPTVVPENWKWNVRPDDLPTVPPTAARP